MRDSVTRATLLFVGFLAGCVGGPLEGGRYACSVDGGAEQCPQAWRCGLEGYCHELGNTSVRWRCRSDDNCENGWQCGVDESRDAGECHNPEVKVAYPCAGDRHCALGWRCGLSGRCQDLDAGAAYACGADGGLDDKWCEQGWRCSPEGLCVDPRLDELLAAPPRTFTPAQKIHPLGSNAPIEHFSVSPSYDTGGGAGRQTVAFLQEGQLRARLVDSRGREQPTHYVLDAGSARALVAMGSRGETRIVAQPYLSDEQSRVFVARPDAGVEVVTLKPGGLAQLEAVDSLAFTPTTRMRLGTAAADLSPRVLAFTDTPRFYRLLVGAPDQWVYAKFRRDGDFSNMTLGFDFIAGNAVVDVAAVRPYQLMDCVFAIDKRGLWANQLTDTPPAPNGDPVMPLNYDFEPLHLPPFTNDVCSPPTGASHQISALASLGRDWLVLRSKLRSAGSGEYLTLLDLRPLWRQGDPDAFCTPKLGYPCTATDRIPVEVRMGPCPVCPGGALLDFAVVDPVQPHLEVRCGGSDGGTTGFFTFIPTSGTQCKQTVPDGESGLFSNPSLLTADHPVGGQVAWASTDGFIWSGPSTASTTSGLFDRPATTVARLGSGADQTLAFARNLSAAQVAGVGFSTQPGPSVVTGVSGEPEWVLTEERELLSFTDAGTIGGGQSIGVIGTMLNSFAGPHSALTTVSSTPARTLVVSAGTSLFSAELDGSPFLAVTLKAVSPGPIDSLAFPPRASAGAYLRGYAVTPNGVLRVTAQTSTRWVFEPILLPPELAPLEVWFEDDRGRVGFADGTVYSLPSRVQLAPPLAEGVVDYAQACGQQLALSPSALFRLERQGTAGLGQWKKLPLPTGFAPSGFAKARLHGVGSSAFVFTRSGETARLTFDGCPSP